MIKEIEDNLDLNYDVYRLMDEIVAQRGRPEMTESLRLIVEDIIVDLKKEQPEQLRDVTPTDVLLALANRGLVEFDNFARPDGQDKYVWAATLKLMECLETGGYGIVKHSKRRRAKLRLDKSVTEGENDIFKYWYRGWDWQCRTMFVLDCENFGDVIPYKDDAGRLAWKAPASDDGNDRSNIVNFHDFREA